MVFRTEEGVRLIFSLGVIFQATEDLLLDTGERGQSAIAVGRHMHEIDFKRLLRAEDFVLCQRQGSVDPRDDGAQVAEDMSARCLLFLFGERFTVRVLCICSECG